MRNVRIRAVAEGDRTDWQRLYAGYARFYERELTETGAQTVWGWLMDAGGPLDGLVAEVEGDVVGIAHYRDMPSPLRGTVAGFLDDLFVDPDMRGGAAGEPSIAELLLAEIARIGAQRGWPSYRWITSETNFRARGLYERVADRTQWVTYEYTC